jgi:hypothetical protein
MSSIVTSLTEIGSLAAANLVYAVVGGNSRKIPWSAVQSTVALTWPTSAVIAGIYPTSAAVAGTYPTSAAVAGTYPTSAAVAGTYPSSAAAATAYQPLDADLTAIAALTTTAAGRSALTLADPNADRIAFWDDSAGSYAHLTPGDGLSISGTTLSVAIDANTEAAIESAIDTLANLTSVQGQTISLAAPLTIPADPNADRLLFWDDSAGATAWLTAGSGLSISGTTISATGGGGGLTLVTADLDLFVRSDGSDSNDGLTDTAGGAFLTLARAMEEVANYDFQNLYSVTINVGDGSYNVGTTLKFARPFNGSGVIVGNITTPANVSVTATGDTFTLTDAGFWSIRGFKLTSTSFGGGVWVTNNSEVYSIGHMEFGNMPDAMLGSTQGGKITWNAGEAFRVTGTNSRGIIRVTEHGKAFLESFTLTIVNAWTIPSTSAYGFVWANHGGVLFFSPTIVGGANVTGRRYFLASLCVYGGTDPDTLPGTTTGYSDNSASIAIGGGYQFASEQLAALPSTSTLRAGSWGLFKDTAGGVVSLAYNDAGTVKSWQLSALTSLDASGNLSVPVGTGLISPGSLNFSSEPAADFDNSIVFNLGNDFTGPIFQLFTDNPGSTGPFFFARHDSPSPAVGDVLLFIRAQGDDSGGVPTNYVDAQLKILDPTNGSEDGELTLTTIVAGSSAVRFKVSNGIIVGSSSVYPGDGNIRATNLEIGHDTDTTLSRVSAGDLQIESSIIYRAGGTDVALADGGTGSSLSDPNLDQFMFWDDSAGAVKFAALADLTTEAAPASGDFIIIYGAEGDLRKANWSTLPAGGGSQTPWTSNIDADGFNLLFDDSTGILSSEAGNPELLEFVSVASAVNFLEIENAATGSGPTIRAVGDDTNVGVNIVSKGIGILSFTTEPTGDFTDCVFFDLGGTASGPTFQLFSDNPGNCGPFFFSRHDSPSPAVGDVLLFIRAQGDDSGGTPTNYCDAQFKILDPTNLSEDGEFTLTTLVGGSSAVRFKVGDGVIVGAGTTYPGAGKARLDGLEIGHDTDTSLTRVSAGDLQIESNIIYRAGGTDVPLTDGGTGASTAAGAVTNLGLDNTKIGAIGVTFDGAGSAVAANTKRWQWVPYGCTINDVTITSDVSCTAVVDIWVDTYANYQPTVADTITASAKPTITAATKNQDTTLTGWTTSIAAGRFVMFNVDSNNNATVLQVVLKVTKT